VFVNTQNLLFSVFDDGGFDMDERYRDIPFAVCFDFSSSKHMKRVVNFLLDNHKTSAAFTGHCRSCMMDYQSELTKVDSQFALVVTRWISLGLGLSMQDSLWAAQSVAPRYEASRSFDEPRPRSCFEYAASRSVKDLRARNLSLLHDQQYKRVISFVAEGDWNLWDDYEDTPKP
jgi:hypothetical protein